MTEEKKRLTCGEFGGQRPDGEPCGLHAGWGTDHRGTGRCKSHSIDTLQKHNDLKKELLESIQTNPMLTLEAAALGVGRGLSWLSDMRRKDSEFDQELMAAHAVNDNTRTQMVEETFVERLISGKAGSSEYFFYLANRAPSRYRSISHVVHQGDKERPIHIVAEETRKAVQEELSKMGSRMSAGVANRISGMFDNDPLTNGKTGEGNGVG